MPPNGVILASGAAVAVSVAVAAAIALYESPELRRYADDLRRRIAIAVEGFQPPQHSREPIFNRPEDADGFMLSRGGRNAEPGVEADEETQRRQREELMYWNSVMLERQRKAEGQEKPQAIEGAQERPAVRNRGSSFDDFLTKDKDTGEEGAFVFNSGAETQRETNGLRHRGEANRGIATALLANPFADEFGIGNDELQESQARETARARDEILSDIYSATTRDYEDAQAEVKPEAVPALIDISEEPVSHTESAASNADYDRVEAGRATPRSEDQEDAYASIQAWAQDAAQNQSAPAPSFYSPLPVTPAAPVSEPDLISDGQLTPTDSMSIIDAGEDFGRNEARSVREAGTSEGGRPYDVLSESEGMLTPASWSEVGSVVSETEGPMPLRS